MTTNANDVIKHACINHPCPLQVTPLWAFVGMRLDHRITSVATECIQDVAKHKYRKDNSLYEVSINEK